MPPVGFKPTILADERPQTYALDGAGTGAGVRRWLVKLNLDPRKFLDSMSVCWQMTAARSINGLWTPPLPKIDTSVD